MSPLQHYLALKTAGRISDDAAQRPALMALEDLFQRIVASSSAPRRLQRQRSAAPVQGLYLWGHVGRGKTFLMDLLVASLPPDVVLRQHFHHFMADVHRQLRTLAGQRDPLQRIAAALSQQTRVLCFDEFFVSDIGDAMLLGPLLQRLFQQGVILVATSNTPPERLYWNGLQRERFLAAIDAIQTHTRCLHMTGEKDHREHAMEDSCAFFLEPDAPEACQQLHQRLLDALQLPAPRPEENASLCILGRPIRYIARHERTICFAFSALCEGPRSHFDYIEIAAQFDTVLVFGVPRLSGVMSERIKARGTEDGAVGSGLTGERQILLAPQDDAARRFIALVDELYDQRAQLVVTSTVALQEIYTEGSLLFEFQRARSRLQEMGSPYYTPRHSAKKNPV